MRFFGKPEVDSYELAKSLLEDEVYFDHRETIYCRASFDKNRRIITKENIQRSRAARLEWEHAVPAENFGRAFTAWREGDPKCVANGKAFKGRQCARLASREFQKMEADMHNLFPAIGQINAMRGYRQYAELPDQLPALPDCGVKVADRKFEPPDHAKGQLARASLYMDANYKSFHLSSQQKRLFEAWNNSYPVTEWECVRSRRIEKLQGQPNNFVKESCIKAGLWH